MPCYMVLHPLARRSVGSHARPGPPCLACLRCTRKRDSPPASAANCSSRTLANGLGRHETVSADPTCSVSRACTIPVARSHLPLLVGRVDLMVLAYIRLNAAGKLRLRRRRRCGRRPALEMVVFEQVHARLAVNASAQHKSSRTRNGHGLLVCAHAGTLLHEWLLRTWCVTTPSKRIGTAASPCSLSAAQAHQRAFSASRLTVIAGGDMAVERHLEATTRHRVGEQVTSVMSIESSSHPPSVGFPRMSFGFSETCRRTHPSAAPTTHARTTAPRLAMPDRPQSPAYSGCLLTHAGTAMPAQCRTRRSPRSRT